MTETTTEFVVTDRRRKGRRKPDTRRTKATTEEAEGPSESFLSEERRAEKERRRAERRRQIDPTTCERDYSGNEVEFMKAMDDYKRRSGRPFPTWSEVLEVLISLGYRKVADPTTLEWRTYGDS